MWFTIATFVLAFGVAAFFIRARGKEYKARQAQVGALQTAAASWPSTTGTVVSTDVISRVVGASDAKYAVYSALVTYTFQVGATIHTGTSLRAGEGAGLATRETFDRPDQAAVIVARYPAGSTVPVYYDPADPASNNCLER